MSASASSTFGTYEGDLNETMWQDIADDKGVTLEEFMSAVDPKEFKRTPWPS